MSSREDRVPLTAEDAGIVKGMVDRGDVQSDIAAFFGVNGGRISEINTGKRFREIIAAPAGALPPPGPYPVGRSAVRARQTLEALQELIEQALADISLFEGIGNK